MRCWALAIAGLLATRAAAETVTDHQIWPGINVSGSTKSGLLYFVDAKPRFDRDASRWSALLVRGGIGTRIGDAVSIYAGYAHRFTPVDDGHDSNEDRLFGQLSWTMGKVAGGDVSSRARLEFRKSSTGDDVGVRVRGFLRYVHPLGDPKRIRALVSAELFVLINDTDWGSRAGIDQFRTFAGLEVPLRRKNTLEIGYMNQVINDPGGRVRLNHIAALTLLIRP